jgi:hypothetical protein
MQKPEITDVKGLHRYKESRWKAQKTHVTSIDYHINGEIIEG